MALDIHGIYDSIHKFIFNDDPFNVERIGPFYIHLTLVLMYVSFVKVIGPKLMEPYKPLKIKYLLIAFNVTIVLWNGYVSYNLFTILMEGIITRRICLLRKSKYFDYYTRRAFGYIWAFYLSKYVDLLDTIFFVLRKKYRQITFLHVFHHSVVLLVSWCGLHFQTIGTYIGVLCCINSFVHVCTYTYYTLAAFGPSMQKIVNPYKKYLTIIQVAQFIILLSYLFFGILTGCEELDIMIVCLTGFISVLMVLFANFYIKIIRMIKYLSYTKLNTFIY